MNGHNDGGDWGTDGDWAAGRAGRDDRDWDNAIFSTRKLGGKNPQPT